MVKKFDWTSVDWNNPKEAEFIAKNVPLKELHAHLVDANKAIAEGHAASLYSSMKIVSGQITKAEAEKSIKATMTGFEMGAQLLERMNILADAVAIRKRKIVVEAAEKARSEDVFTLHNSIHGFEKDFLNKRLGLDPEDFLKQKSIHRVLMNRIVSEQPLALGTNNKKKLFRMESSLAEDLKNLKAMKFDKKSDDMMEHVRADMHRKVLVRTDLLHEHVKRMAKL